MFCSEFLNNLLRKCTKSKSFLYLNFWDENEFAHQNMAFDKSHICQYLHVMLDQILKRQSPNDNTNKLNIIKLSFSVYFQIQSITWSIHFNVQYKTNIIRKETQWYEETELYRIRHHMIYKLLFDFCFYQPYYFDRVSFFHENNNMELYYKKNITNVDLLQS